MAIDNMSSPMMSPNSSNALGSPEEVSTPTRVARRDTEAPVTPMRSSSRPSGNATPGSNRKNWARVSGTPVTPMNPHQRVVAASDTTPRSMSGPANLTLSSDLTGGSVRSSAASSSLLNYASGYRRITSPSDGVHFALPADGPGPSGDVLHEESELFDYSINMHDVVANSGSSSSPVVSEPASPSGTIVTHRQRAGSLGTHISLNNSVAYVTDSETDETSALLPNPGTQRHQYQHHHQQQQRACLLPPHRPALLPTHYGTAPQIVYVQPRSFWDQFSQCEMVIVIIVLILFSLMLSCITYMLIRIRLR
ncbi:hypothetical protein M426DRAFT_115285 [Hypoxylon sp. CI-4A]|nr:hypothetical protein M426DRAFT_115285 [Hypoxylon sp. CI-4A]